MFKTMEILLFWGLVSLASAQFIIYGGNVPQRDPTQPFIIYGNNPQPSFSGGNPPPQPFIGGIPPPGPPPQPFIGGIPPPGPPPQPFIGGIPPPGPPPQPFISGGISPPSPPPPPPFISGGIIPQAPLPNSPLQPILGGNPFQQVSDGSFSPNPLQQLTSVNLPPQQPIFGGSPPQSTQALVPARATGGSNADGAFGDSEYHYSWLHDGGQEYNHDGAIRYCNGLGGGWRAVSIESLDESFFINVVVNSHKKMYIWTAGVKDGSGWRWLNGGPLTYTNWSFTGGKGQPQPDDREGNENCLGILNNIYRDGIKWHDIACHHAKAIICERSAQKSSF